MSQRDEPIRIGSPVRYHGDGPFDGMKGNVTDKMSGVLTVNFGEQALIEHRDYFELL